MSEPTVEQLMNMDKVTVTKASVFGPVVAFFFFPPLGVYLLWKEKSFHKTFALLSITLGVVNLLSGISIYSFVFTNLDSIYKSLEITSGKPNSLNIILFILISLIQGGVSFYLWQRAKKQGSLEMWGLVTLAIAVVIFDYIVLPLLIGAVIFNIIWPLYQQNLDPYKNFKVN